MNIRRHSVDHKKHSIAPVFSLIDFQIVLGQTLSMPIERDIMEGLVEGKRGRGRPRLQWSDKVTQWTDLTFEKGKHTVKDRPR